MRLYPNWQRGRTKNPFSGRSNRLSRTMLSMRLYSNWQRDGFQMAASGCSNQLRRTRYKRRYTAKDAGHSVKVLSMTG